MLILFQTILYRFLVVSSRFRRQVKYCLRKKNVGISSSQYALQMSVANIQFKSQQSSTMILCQVQNLCNRILWNKKKSRADLFVAILHIVFVLIYPDVSKYSVIPVVLDCSTKLARRKKGFCDVDCRGAAGLVPVIYPYIISLANTQVNHLQRKLILFYFLQKTPFPLLFFNSIFLSKTKICSCRRNAFALQCLYE